MQRNLTVKIKTIWFHSSVVTSGITEIKTGIAEIARSSTNLQSLVQKVSQNTGQIKNEMGKFKVD